MLLMVQQDQILKRICPEYEQDPEGVMDFLQKLPQEHRLAFLRRNNRFFGGLQLPARLARTIERGLPDGLEGEFYRLADSWIFGTMFDSFEPIINRHSAYQQIVNLGMPAVVFILQELQIEPDWWFTLLSEIVGEESPVIPEEDKDKAQLIANIWLEWGRSRGLIA